jgi:hypothetical protein
MSDILVQKKIRISSKTLTEYSHDRERRFASIVNA